MPRSYRASPADRQSSWAPIAAGGPRNIGIAESLLAAGRPAYPGEYDFLGTAWPEMASFLTSHGLSRRAVTDDAAVA